MAIKFIAYILISLIIFCGCSPPGGINTNPPVPDEEPSESIPEPPTETPAPEKESPYAFILSPDFDRSGGIGIDSPYDEPFMFDFGEFTWSEYPSGEWSVDELVKKYGETDSIEGSIGITGHVYIGITWWGGVDNIQHAVILIAERNGAFSFDTDSSFVNEPYTLTTEDRNIKSQVYQIFLFGEEYLLPRGLKIGQSTFDEIKSAYPVEVYEYGYNVVYNYVWFDEIAAKPEIENADLGYVKYSGDMKGILYCVEIGLPSDLLRRGL